MDRPDWIDELLPELPDTTDGRPDAFPIEPEPDPLSDDGAASEQARLVLDELFRADAPLVLAGGANPPAQIKDPATGGLTLPHQAFDNGLSSHANPVAASRLDELFGAADFSSGDDAAVLALAAGPCVPMTVDTAADESYDGGDLVAETADGGGLSLREAIGLANAAAGADMINFAAGLSGMTITLGGTQLSITGDVTIDGDIDGDDGADITISGDADMSGTANTGDSRVFYINTSGPVGLHSLNLTGGYGQGGGIFLYGGTVNLAQSSVSGNAAGSANGGGIYTGGGTMNISGSTISGNTSGSAGGGIYNMGTLSLVNTTVSGNSASFSGGGMTLGTGGTATITNSTIANNSTFFAKGGGIELFSGTLSLANTVVAQNTANGDNDIFNYSGGLTAQNSFIGNYVVIDTDNGGNDNGVTGNAMLGMLADNGGPVYTMAPLAGSALIDAGNDALIPGGTTQDADGNERSVAGAVDIGAAEVQLVVDTTDDTDTVGASFAADLSDGSGLTLREAIAWAGSGDTITFDAAIAGSTITVASQLTLASSVTIDGDTDGDGAADITVSGNNAVRVIQATGGTSVLNGLTVTAGSGDGGGLRVLSTADVTVTNSTCTGNYSSTFGGAIFNNGTLALTNVTLSGNSAYQGGGGLFNFGPAPSATLTNATVAGNSTISGAAYGGGGLYNGGANSVLTLINSTVSGNTSANDGGGLHVFGGTITLTNSIVLGNTAAGADNEILLTSATLTKTGGNIVGTDIYSGASDVGDTSSASVFASVTGVAGDLADNGGVVQTVALIAGGDALDIGDASLLPADTQDLDGDGNTSEDIPFDARGDGFDRVSGVQPDLGAFELVVNSPAVANDDAFATAELTIVNGTSSVFDDNVLGADSDPEMDPFAVTAVNGNAGNVGMQITLASGALLILNSDGTFSYDPNGVFEPTPLGSTDADSFTYEITGGDTATVNITINGIDNDDVFVGTAAIETFDGGVGTDTVDYRDSTGAVSVRLWNGTGLGGDAEGDTLSSIENVVGSSGEDLLSGNSAANRLDGRGGADTINAGGGADVLVGGGGNDLLLGGTGADDLIGGNGKDTADYTDSSAGVTVRQWNGTGLGGDAQGDTLDSVENVTGSAFGDLLAGNSAANVLDGGKGNDTLNAGSGNDTLIGGTGKDDLLGGDGTDSADYRDSGAAVQVRLWNGTGIGGQANGDTLDSIENVVGSAKNDLLAGDSAANRLDGRGGADTINAGSGGDTLIGGGGNDTLIGGNGNDTHIGGNGNDTFVFADNSGVNTITDFSANDAEDIDLSAVTAITDFTDLVNNHLVNAGGTAQIIDGANSILLTGITVAEIGAGLTYSEDDFVF